MPEDLSEESEDEDEIYTAPTKFKSLINLGNSVSSFESLGMTDPLRPRYRLSKAEKCIEKLKIDRIVYSEKFLG